MELRAVGEYVRPKPKSSFSSAFAVSVVLSGPKPSAGASNLKGAVPKLTSTAALRSDSAGYTPSSSAAVSVSSHPAYAKSRP